jgi:hypothetical protein
METNLEQVVETIPMVESSEREELDCSKYEGLKLLGVESYSGPTSIMYWM